MVAVVYCGFSMAVLPIVTGADSPILRTKTKNVATVTKDILQLVGDMERTCNDADGLGIAAPQVGVSQRLCLAKINGKLTPLINPRITQRSDNVTSMEEGCLSLPGINVDVVRPVSIVVQYLDAAGKPQERALRGMDARVVQHEVDHLEGILIVDYLPANIAATQKQNA